MRMILKLSLNNIRLCEYINASSHLFVYLCGKDYSDDFEDEVDIKSPKIPISKESAKKLYVKQTKSNQFTEKVNIYCVFRNFQNKMNEIFCIQSII